MAINFNFQQTCKHLEGYYKEIQPGFGRMFHCRILWLAEQTAFNVVASGYAIDRMDWFANLADCLLEADNEG